MATNQVAALDLQMNVRKEGNVSDWLPGVSAMIL